MLARVGVPLICPVDEFRLNPGGNAPEPIAQKYGAVPPLAAIAALYDAPIEHIGKYVVVIVTGVTEGALTAVTVTFRSCEAVCRGEDES